MNDLFEHSDNGLGQSPSELDDLDAFCVVNGLMTGYTGRSVEGSLDHRCAGVSRSAQRVIDALGDGGDISGFSKDY